MFPLCFEQGNLSETLPIICAQSEHWFTDPAACIADAELHSGVDVIDSYGTALHITISDTEKIYRGSSVKLPRVSQ